MLFICWEYVCDFGKNYRNMNNIEFDWIGVRLFLNKYIVVFLFVLLKYFYVKIKVYLLLKVCLFLSCEF